MGLRAIMVEDRNVSEMLDFPPRLLLRLHFFFSLSFFLDLLSSAAGRGEEEILPLLDPAPKTGAAEPQPKG